MKFLIQASVTSLLNVIFKFVIYVLQNYTVRIFKIFILPHYYDGWDGRDTRLEVFMAVKMDTVCFSETLASTDESKQHQSPKEQHTVKFRLSGNSSIGKVALAAYFHRAHYNSPMALAAYFHRAHYNSPVALAAYFHRAHYNSPVALAAYFCRYPASRGISRAVPKVSESSTGGALRTDQLTRRLRLVFFIAHIKIAYRRSPFSLTAESIYWHTPFPKRAG
jgi:hypothetical protein